MSLDDIKVINITPLYKQKVVWYNEDWQKLFCHGCGNYLLSFRPGLTRNVLAFCRKCGKKTII